MPTTQVLLDRLASDITLRRICGWERVNDVPHESTFSRAFDEFSRTQLPQLVHETFIKTHYANEIVGHVARDSTAIEAREKPVKKVSVVKQPGKPGRPKKDEVRTKPLTRIERQANGMSIDAMLDELPQVCDVGTKKNSKGYKTSWTGYKLHIDAADGGIPISCVLTSKNFNTQLASGKLTYEGQFRVQSPSTGRALPVTVSRSADVDINRLGKAVTKVAKLLGPVGVGIAIADLICTETTICSDGIGGWESSLDSPFNGYPQTVPKFIYCTGFGCTISGQPADGPTPDIACQNTASIQSENFNYSHSTQTECHLTRVFNGDPFVSNINQFPGACPTNYIDTGSECTLNDTTEPTPTTDQDWIDVENTLNDSAFIEPMFDGQHDLPVAAPDTFPPVNTIVGEKTTQLKDSNGNVTGSQVETTTLTLTDASTTDSPNLMDVKETKTTINYDINNNITDQSTTVIENSPSEQPAEDDITFDEVSDSELEEKEVSAILDTTSWGGGSCPAPIAMDTTFGSYQFDTQPFCDYAEALKPFILIVASIIAGLIILRSRQT